MKIVGKSLKKRSIKSDSKTWNLSKNRKLIELILKIKSFKNINNNFFKVSFPSNLISLKVIMNLKINSNSKRNQKSNFITKINL